MSPRLITEDKVMNKNYTERKSNPAEKLIQHGWSILLYDGRCWLCTSIVRFAAQRAGHHLIAFCAVQSDSGRAALNRSIATPGKGYGVLVFEEERVLKRSDAYSALWINWTVPGSELQADCAGSPTQYAMDFTTLL